MTRLNYTGRRRITRNLVSLEVIDDTPHPRASLGPLDLSTLDLPDDASVSLEAFRQNRYMRLDCGTVGSPLVIDREPLTDFNDAIGIQFRLKVTGEGGRIVAAANRIRASRPDLDHGPAEGLLPFRSADLGAALWRLHLDDGGPVVEVNQRLDDWKSFAATIQFRVLVYPEVVRRIGYWLLENADQDEDDGVLADWRSFAEELGTDTTDRLDDEQAREEWTEDLVQRFSSRHDLLNSFLRASEDGEL